MVSYSSVHISHVIKGYQQLFDGYSAMSYNLIILGYK